MEQVLQQNEELSLKVRQLEDQLLSLSMKMADMTVEDIGVSNQDSEAVRENHRLKSRLRKLERMLLKQGGSGSTSADLAEVLLQGGSSSNSRRVSHSSKASGNTSPSMSTAAASESQSRSPSASTGRGRSATLNLPSSTATSSGASKATSMDDNFLDSDSDDDKEDDDDPLYVDELLDACKNGDTSTVARIVTGHPELVNVCNRNGYTPLMWACHANSKDIVSILITKGANVDARRKVC